MQIYQKFALFLFLIERTLHSLFLAFEDFFLVVLYKVKFSIEFSMTLLYFGGEVSFNKIKHGVYFDDELSVDFLEYFLLNEFDMIQLGDYLIDFLVIYVIILKPIGVIEVIFLLIGQGYLLDRLLSNGFTTIHRYTATLIL